MAARPGEWHLLTDDGQDPVPGDPYEVAASARYYADMASTIEAEAARLTALGQKDGLVGQYSTSLADDLGKLAGDLKKAHGRYRSVGEALGPFATALSTARDESAAALRDAVSADHDLQRAQGMPDPSAPAPGQHPTAQQQADDQAARAARDKAVGAANDALAAARNRLTAALGDLSQAGKKAAGQIHDGADDALKDHHHWWDVVVKIVKIVVELANYVAMGAALVMLFVPGLDLLDIALMATLVAFGGDSLLFATGNASIVDLGLDLVGLVTLGIGGGLAAAGKELGAESAEFAAKYAARNYREFADVAEYGGRTLTESAGNYAREIAGTARGSSSTLLRLSVGGEREIAEARTVTRALSGAFGRSTKLAAYADEAARVTRLARLNFAAGSGSLLGNLLFSPSNLPLFGDRKPYWSGYNKLKEGLVPQSPFHVEEWAW